MRLSLASICLLFIFLLALAGAVLAETVLAETGTETNRIFVMIDAFALEKQELLYNDTTSLNATLTNNSTFLSGTVEVSIIAPPEFRKMINVSGLSTLFFGLGQTQNVTLNIQNVGTLTNTTTVTLTLQVKSAGWITTDKLDFKLSLGANPNIKILPKPNPETNLTDESSLTVMCFDRQTNLPVPGLTVEAAQLETGVIVSSNTDEEGQCTLQLENSIEANENGNGNITLTIWDKTEKYLSTTQIISNQTQVTFYLDEALTDDDGLFLIAVVTVVVIVISCIFFLIYKRRIKVVA